VSIHSRLSKFERSLQYRELALLRLKTAQGRSQYSEYWKIGEFQPWASENEEAGLMYQLAFEVNGAVMMAAQGWRMLMSWASLLGIFMLVPSPQSKPSELVQPEISWSSGVRNSVPSSAKWSPLSGRRT
jgi:hypothetical protein